MKKGETLMYGNDFARRYPRQYIRKGDRIYVRVMQDRRSVLEFSVDSVADYTALIGEIRYAGRNLEGLARVFVRNHSRGWSEERPMMFYQGLAAPRRNVARNRLPVPSVAPTNRPRMINPWETH